MITWIQNRALHWSAFFLGVYWILSAALVFIAFPVFPQQRATITYVIDGDTVVLDDGRKVRLIGINAPEQKTDNREAEPFSLEARLALSELVENTKVKLIFGEEKYDRYGRTLAYIELDDGSDIQAALIARGYAAVIAFPPNITKVDSYLSIEKQARYNKAGIWSNDKEIINLDNLAEIPAPGFHVVIGRITGFKKSKNNIYFNMGDRFKLKISNDNWNNFWRGQSGPEFVGKRIETRGWVTGSGKYGTLVVRHPTMIVELSQP